MGKITLVLGGARSGKSKKALDIAKDYKRVAFLATAEAKDVEMSKRIRLHKNSRPGGWKTFEEPLKVSSLLKNISPKFDLFILDCLTLLVCNLMLAHFKPTQIEREIKQILKIVQKNKADLVIVANEVGLGIVPENKLSRDFRDIAGRANQIVACASNEVFFMAAGISLKIK